MDSRQQQRSLIEACIGELKVKESERLTQLFLRSEQGYSEQLEKDMNMLRSHFSLIQLKSGRLPKTIEELRTLRNIEIPKDPWGNEYQYAINSNCTSGFEVFSYGPDKKKGQDDISTCNH